MVYMYSSVQDSGDKQRCAIGGPQLTRVNGVEMLRVEACLGQAWLKRQRVLRDPGLIDDPRPPPKRREPSA